MAENSGPIKWTIHLPEGQTIEDMSDETFKDSLIKAAENEEFVRNLRLSLLSNQSATISTSKHPTPPTQNPGSGNSGSNGDVF